MNAETTKVSGMFDELKTFITNLLKPEKPEVEESGSTEGATNETIMVAPAELTAKLTAFQTALDAIETNENAVAEAETLKGEKADMENRIAALDAEDKTKAEKIIELEGKLTKLNGGSTQVDGPEGLEDPDETNMNPEQKALKNDLAHLRGELVNVHQ